MEEGRQSNLHLTGISYLKVERFLVLLISHLLLVKILTTHRTLRRIIEARPMPHTCTTFAQAFGALVAYSGSVSASPTCPAQGS